MIRSVAAATMALFVASVASCLLPPGSAAHAQETSPASPPLPPQEVQEEKEKVETASPAEPAAPQPFEEAMVSQPALQEAPTSVDVVFAIDCSGSMSRMIDQAKEKVVEIVGNIRSFAPSAPLRIGLIRYGDTNRRFAMFPLSTDHATVYKNLMATTSELSAFQEWVGLFVRKAANEMNWTHDARALKLLYVIGNETAAQQPDAEYHFQRTVPAAARSGIIVNAILCTIDDPRFMNRSAVARQDEQRLTWASIAQLGGGEYLELSGANAPRRPLRQLLPAPVQPVQTSFRRFSLGSGFGGRPTMLRSAGSGIRRGR